MPAATVALIKATCKNNTRPSFATSPLLRMIILTVLFPVKDMSAYPVPSGVPNRGNYEDLMNLIEESVVVFIDWEGNRRDNAIILTNEAIIQVMAPLTYPRTLPLEIIVP